MEAIKQTVGETHLYRRRQPASLEEHSRALARQMPVVVHIQWQTPYLWSLSVQIKSVPATAAGGLIQSLNVTGTHEAVLTIQQQGQES